MGPALLKLLVILSGLTIAAIAIVTLAVWLLN